MQTQGINNSLKCNNFPIIRLPEGEKEKGTEGLFEQIIPEKNPNLVKETGSKT